jgi:hypothetical protein
VLCLILSVSPNSSNEKETIALAPFVVPIKQHAPPIVEEAPEQRALANSNNNFIIAAAATAGNSNVVSKTTATSDLLASLRRRITGMSGAPTTAISSSNSSNSNSGTTIELTNGSAQSMLNQSSLGVSPMTRVPLSTRVAPSTQTSLANQSNVVIDEQLIESGSRGQLIDSIRGSSEDIVAIEQRGPTQSPVPLTKKTP